MDEDIEMKEEEDTFSNSSEHSSSEEDVDDGKIAELKNEIESDPYVYDRHVQCIDLCRKRGNLEELRSAREKMSKLFPLTPELWLDWISDEKNLATTKEQKENLTALFQRALKDYSSVQLWLEYCLYSIGNIGEEWDVDGLEVTRTAFEDAITAVGIHVTQGCLIWEAYRQFESDYLSILKNKGASDNELKEQEEKIYNIFRRQLSVPLFDMDKTYEEFRELFDENSHPDINSIEYSYKKALQKLDQIAVHENSLYQSESPHYEEFKEYINYEKRNGDASRVQNVYERALVENCLKEELWLDYTKYLDRDLKNKDISLPVHQRAVKNLPWCVQIWVRYGRALEQYHEPHEKIRDMFENVLMTGGFVEEEKFKELWLAYLDYLRRRISTDPESGITDLNEIEAVFTNATTQMAQYFWGTESEYIIMKYYTFFNVKYKKDIKTAREYWKEIIDHGHKDQANVWLDYANFERLYGDADHYRKTLLQALSSVNDWPETFLELLITFEREEGTLESLEKSLIRCETLILFWIYIFYNNLLNLYEILETPESHGSLTTHDTLKDSRTVFASNLSFKIEEERIKEFFSQMGEVEEVRLVKDYKGRSKGFCYVLYKTQVEAKNALSKDREPLDGRPVYISTCEDKKNNPSFQSKFKFGTGLERNKLFLKNLPPTTTKDDLENMYKEYGTLKDIRIVTYRNGHSKGLAYVEFQDEAAAANAVVKTDGIQILDNVISVAISNPPPRKQQRDFPVASISESLGGGGGQTKGPRGRGRTQLALVPRAVARQPLNRKSSLPSIQNGQNSSSSSSEEERKPLSNSDFAKMLQK
ncbi:squamous cell carcinoma antigen recognized by T-cells 3 [Parasteatoda tepidariorum]|uniref:squamous cell carcinoma antigen recognized by T-cells 3 n=1 Tax=Parasteatoda tepidariorum TaxID=114398 RepID=UPI001C725089|nr:squamous cell carcinoma antigen recognized by T-cells 3 [Parasteatoda tepidariorum]